MSIQKIFVIGAGFMGTGIAQNSITVGYDVILRTRDASPEKVEKITGKISKSLGKFVEKGKISQEDMDSALKRFSVVADFNAAADADIVIEAVAEDVALKKGLFESLDGICKTETIFATNTSSISITEVASATKRPEKVIGTHFFSPVPLMKLLEVVKGLRTSGDTVDSVMEMGEKLGKVCVISKDSPAFIVNRMLNPMINEAIGLLEAGVGSVEDIDNAMKSGLNHPMGPLELIDMAGIDIELAVMEVLYAETGDSKYRPCGLLRNMVRAGYLGRKTGAGFYVYPEDGPRYPNPDLI
jgi:3-hydroxybutyryl-CoA dehydrogenase